MKPLSFAGRSARWLMAAGLALAAMQGTPAKAQLAPDLVPGLDLEGGAQPHPGHGRAKPFFEKVGAQLDCDYVRYRLRFGAQGDPAKFADPAFAAYLQNVRLDFRDTLPDGLEIVDVQVSGDGTDAVGGPLPAASISTVTNPNDTVKVDNFRLSTTDLDGSGEIDRRYVDFVITAKIDHAAFAAPTLVDNQGFVGMILVGGPAIMVPSHDPALPDDGSFAAGEPTKLLIDLTRCDRPPPPPPGEECFKVEIGEVDCVPGGGAFIYHMPVGPELGGKWVQVRTTTPGIVVAPMAQLVPAGGGVLNWTITGALPGDAVHLIVTGIETYAGPEEGVGLCCTQTVDIVIPPDLECPPERGEPDIEILKRADDERCTPEGPCDFTIRVTNVGDAPYNGPIVLDEVTAPGNAAVVSGPNPPWACVPMASPMSCTHPATTLDPGEWVELKLGFAPGPGWEAPFIGNCAEYDYTASGKPDVFGRTDNDKDCARIPICRRGDPRCNPPVDQKRPDLRIEKTCEQGTAAGAAVSCRITISNDGTAAPTGPVRVHDAAEVIGSGTPVQILTVTPDGAEWACGPVPANTLSCQIPGAVMTPGTSRHFDVTVLSPTYGRFENCARGNWGPAPGNDIVYPFGEACAEGGGTTINVEKTGDKECRVGEPCTFEITITNSGTTGFSGPVRIGDAIGVEGLGRLEGVPISEIVPPFGCSPEPTTLPMSCVATMTLGAGESRVHQVTVVIPADGPLANIREPVSARNCVGVVSPDAPVASVERNMTVAPETTGRPGTQPYACHGFTIARQVAEQCSQGFVMNADGRCVCPEGTTFRNGQCRPVGGEPPPPPPPPPAEECKLLPGQIRTEDGRCVCPRGTRLIRGECRKPVVEQCKLLPGQIRLEDGRCVCPRGTRLIRGECRKPVVEQCKLLPGQIRLEDGRCVCPRGTRLIRGECRKPVVEQCKLLPGQIRLENGRCVCPRGTSLIRGACRKDQPDRCPRGTVGTPPNCRKLQIQPISPDLQQLLRPRQPTNNNIQGQ